MKGAWEVPFYKAEWARERVLWDKGEDENKDRVTQHPVRRGKEVDCTLGHIGKLLMDL